MKLAQMKLIGFTFGYSNGTTGGSVVKALNALEAKEYLLQKVPDIHDVKVVYITPLEPKIEVVSIYTNVAAPKA